MMNAHLRRTVFLLAALASALVLSSCWLSPSSGENAPHDTHHEKGNDGQTASPAPTLWLTTRHALLRVNQGSDNVQRSTSPIAGANHAEVIAGGDRFYAARCRRLSSL